MKKTFSWFFACLSTIALGAASVPTDLNSVGICRDRFTARWTNPDAVVSNEIEVVRISPDAFEATFAANYTFDAIGNPGKTPKPLDDDDFAAKMPGFGGQAVYAAANSTGLLQIGTSSKAGCLEFAGLPSYAGLTMVVYAQRMGAKSGTMPIEYVIGNKTNELVALSITEDMDHYEIPMEGVEGGARILFRSHPKGDRRIQVDSIGFASDFAYPYSRTNLVERRTFPACESYRVRNLAPTTRYFWRVGGYGPDSVFAGFADYLAVDTNGVPPPSLSIVIR